MKCFLRQRSNRYGYDGWAVALKGDNEALFYWTVSTTRKEARDAQREMMPEIRRDTEVVKIKIKVARA